MVLSEEEEEAYKKSVKEKRQLIEKRLSEERKIPASTQRHEIVQEITTLKRQSLVEEKVKDGEFEEKPRESVEKEQIISEEQDKVKTKTTITKETITTTKELPTETTKTKKTETIEIVRTVQPTEEQIQELEKKLADQKMKIERTDTDEKPQITTKITTTIVETRTTEPDDILTHKLRDDMAQERRESTELLEGVTHELEKLESKKKPMPKPKATEGKFFFL